MQAESSLSTHPRVLLLTRLSLTLKKEVGGERGAREKRAREMGFPNVVESGIINNIDIARCWGNEERNFRLSSGPTHSKQGLLPE